MPFTGLQIGLVAISPVAVHFLERHGARPTVEGVLSLLRDANLRSKISTQARRMVEQRFGHHVVVGAFEKICLHVIKPYAQQHSELARELIRST